MKSRKFIIAIATMFFIATTLVSCHRSTCPTFGKIEKSEIRMDVRS